MRVDRCVCKERSFADLRDLATREGLGFEALRSRTGCAATCGLCEPYIRLMLRTGQTSFPLLSEAEARRVCEQEERGAR